MTENKRFWVESDRILNTYALRIFKDDVPIFEINNWNSLNESNKVECEGIATELNNLSDENEQLKSLLEEMKDKNEEIWLMDGRIIRLKKVLKGDLK